MLKWVITKVGSNKCGNSRTLRFCGIKKLAKEERLLLNILKNRHHSWIGNIIRRNEFVVNVLEGTVSAKKTLGRPRLHYLKQVARYRGAENYTAMERIACNKSRRDAANQSKD
jgi:hypothetical protein